MSDRRDDGDDPQNIRHVPDDMARYLRDDLARQLRDKDDDDDDRDLSRRLFEAGLPPALVKALHDPFIYACGLRNGQVVIFTQAEADPRHEWVTLTLVEPRDLEMWPTPPGTVTIPSPQMPMPRGIDLWLDEIIWVADAPWGS